MCPGSAGWGTAARRGRAPAGSQRERTLTPVGVIFAGPARVTVGFGTQHMTARSDKDRCSRTKGSHRPDEKHAPKCGRPGLAQWQSV